MTLEIPFKITREQILSFAQFTGDRNALHLDEEFARRSRYRECVAHGMLSIGYLVFLQDVFPSRKVCLLKLSGQFSRAAYVGDEILCSIDYEEQDGRGKFSARWVRKASNEELSNAQGEFVLEADQQSVVSAKARQALSFVSNPPVENSYSIDQLQSRKEHFDFSISSESALAYRQALQESLLESTRAKEGIQADSNLLSLLLLSTLIGMKLPGRFATFLSFDLQFQKNINPGIAYSLNGSVEKIVTTSARLSIGATIASSGGETIASGKCVALVNPAPRKMLSCSEIRQGHLDLGIRGKVVLITGASRGIGEVTAKLFALLGAKVAVHFFRGKTDAMDIVNEIEREGGKAFAVQCDVRDEQEVSKMIRLVLEYFGDIDVLVNNVVKDVEPKNLLDLNWDDFLGELEVSLKGLHNCCKAVIPVFQNKQRGKIINLSTTITDCPVSGQAKYISAKSAVVGYTRSLAKELARQNIQANVVSPSLTETDLMLSNFSPAVVSKLTQERESGRNVSPLEVAQSIVFLASDWSGAINGQRLMLNLGEDPFV